MWQELTAQQLVRYEALFKLLDDIQGSDDVTLIANRVARQWKYFASVSSWRMVVFQESKSLVIDGYRGEAHIQELQQLSSWDAHFNTLGRTITIKDLDSYEGPSPPEHLTGKRTEEIMVFPFTHEETRIALLTVATRHEPFSDLDNKFNYIFGSHFADKISGILFRQHMTEALIEKASKDALTGLYNRGAIIEYLESYLALSEREGQPVSIILADIDFFKVINDRHGHLVGDEVLREVSSRLQSELRESDKLGRYGGEEFLLVLYPCCQEEVGKSAERFRQAVAGSPIIPTGDPLKKVHVSISLGTSSTNGSWGYRAIDALLKTADDALYTSKANGRNCVTIGTMPKLPR